MAPEKNGKTLVIVESPAKARTISRFLGPDYVVEASVGHVRDLPASAAEIPAEWKKRDWARLGIDVENDFQPLYVVPKAKQDQIRKLAKLVRAARRVLLATDEDREGESISWHLREVLRPDCEVARLVFHEITKDAIQHALEHPRGIDEDLVEAQEARRLVDRLYGYLVSPLLWKKVRPRLSAGRVQSVAVRLVVERERERIRFRSTEHWDLLGRFRAGEGGDFEARLVEVGGKRVATGKDFDPETGRAKEGADVAHLDEDAARALAARLGGRPAAIEKVERKPFRERPSPPFTTSTLQQEAGRRLRFSAKRTMSAAQRLYENGHITYMRTDSTTLGREALSAARGLIAERFGDAYLPDSPRTYATKVRNAQEAHEAIRPAGARFTAPRDLPASVGADERKLYRLIFERTLACQMADATGERTTLVVGIDDARFQASGKTIRFPGFRKAYVQEEDEAALVAKGEDEDRLLPAVEAGDAVDVRELEPQGHTTQPPARLTEATLVRELERRGIGRPSTYASIIDTILNRNYVFKKGSALVPTFTAFAVVDLLDRHLHRLVDYAFTARMEDDLDEISNGREERVRYLRKFYAGNGSPGLKDEVARAEAEADPREVCSIPIGSADDGTSVEVRVGRYGPYLQRGDVRVQVPDETPPDELTVEKALEMLAKAAEGPRRLGTDPETGLEVLVKVGAWGPYLQLGEPEGGEKPRTASLLAGMQAESVTLEEALAVLALPRELGVRDGEPILAANGRYGPYVRCGSETRSIPEGESPLTITRERAEALLAQPKQRGRGAAQRKVLAELGAHPESGAAVRLLEGRYGPYVTDGETNASLPKSEEPADVTLERAVELLAERAARGPAKRKKRKATKKAAKKTSKTTSKKKAAKKTAKKATTKKAASKKASAAKRAGASEPPSGERDAG